MSLLGRLLGKPERKTKTATKTVREYEIDITWKNRDSFTNRNVECNGWEIRDGLIVPLEMKNWHLYGVGFRDSWRGSLKKKVKVVYDEYRHISLFAIEEFRVHEVGEEEIQEDYEVVDKGWIFPDYRVE